MRRLSLTAYQNWFENILGARREKTSFLKLSYYLNKHLQLQADDIADQVRIVLRSRQLTKI